MSSSSPAGPQRRRPPLRPCPPLPAEDLAEILAQTRGLWEEVRGETIFITGGTGFFGAWLLESFTQANDRLRLGARAVVLTRDPGTFKSRMPHLAARPDLEFLAGHLTDFPFPPGRYAFVIHAANDLDPALAERSPAGMLETIGRGTDHLLAFVAQAGTRKLLLTSSGAVYGHQPADLERMPENYEAAPAPLSPGSAYADGKRLAEQKCLLHAGHLGSELKLARCFAFIGPHLPLNGAFAAGNFIRNALQGEPIQVRGDGTPYRSYLYAADLAAWLWTILFRGQPGRAYNVGADQPLTVAELAAKVARATRPESEVIIAQPAVPGSAAARYVPAIDRARTELSLIPRISLDEAIRRTIQWYRLP